MLWRCRDCGMPHIHSACPLCGQVQRYYYVRVAKLGTDGLKALVRELRATLSQADLELAHIPKDDLHQARLPAQKDGGSPPGTEKFLDPKSSCAEPDSESYRTLVTELLSELMLKGHQLAEAKAHQQVRAPHRSQRLDGTREGVRSQHASDFKGKDGTAKGKRAPGQRVSVTTSPKKLVPAKKRICARCGKAFTVTTNSKNKKVVRHLQMGRKAENGDISPCLQCGSLRAVSA